MAEVWLAEDTRLGRWVAVKLLHPAVDLDHDSIANEARIIARLTHPNIVDVFDAGETPGGQPYLVMEYVHGYTVRQLLQSQGRFTEAEVVRYGTQVANALEYAHRQGVRHRDVKPENILIDENGVAKLTDFGVADTLTRTMSPQQAQEILGTIAYIAPEVLQGAPATPAADVYSLALVLYEMAAGRLPFSGTTAAAMAGQRLAAPPPRLRQFALSASFELEEALARALAPDPRNRFQSAAEFAAALRAVPEPRRHVTAPVVAPPGRPPALRPRDTHTRRHAVARPAPTGNGSGPLIAAGLAALIFALGAAVVAALLITRDDSDGGLEPTPTTAPTQSTQQPSPAATPTRAPSPTAQPSPTEPPTPTQTPPPSPTPVRTPTQAPTPTRTPVANTPTPTQAPPTQPPQATPTPR